MIVSIDILGRETERPGSIALADPIVFEIPLTKNAETILAAKPGSPCTAVQPQCVWSWERDAMHLHSFDGFCCVVASAADMCGEPTGMYYVFAICYILVLCYCVVTIGMHV